MRLFTEVCAVRTFCFFFFFKQKTAYEFSACLVGSEMCIRDRSMPKDKIKSAIDKAFGSGADAAVYENIVYEGYGPAGVAVYVDCLTDNRNRTAADVRSAFSHAGGNLGTSGSVAFQFERKGQIVVAKEILDENAKKETMIANGAAGCLLYTSDAADE